MNKAQFTLSLVYALPVVLSLFYVTEAAKLPILSALLAILLFIYSFTALSARIPRPVLRLSVQITVAVVVAVYLYAQLISYILQGTSINQQFLFHFNLTTLVETWSIYFELVLGFVLWIAIALCATVVLSGRVKPGRAPIALLTFGLLVALLLEPGIRRAAATGWHDLVDAGQPTLADIRWERLGLDRDAVQQDVISAAAGRNLVFIYLEGLEQIYTDNGLFPGLTPTLNTLGREGQRHTDLRQVTGSQWTMGGIVSSMCGTPLLYVSELGGNSLLFTRFLDQAVCLPDVLAEAGYEQVFMGGASTRFAGKGEFLRQHAFDTVLGREELLPRLEDPNYAGSWGLFDDSLFSLAAQQYAELANRGAPFNLTLLTVDTHHPDGEPSPGCPPYPEMDNSILHAVHCTDYLLGRFIDDISRHPAYTNTLVVIASDHLAMPNKAFPLFPNYHDRRLYFTVMNGTGEFLQEGSAVPMDIAPTVLQLMSVEHNARFLAGRDLTQKKARMGPVHHASRRRDNVIAYLNSNVLSSTGEGVLLYALSETDVAALQPSQHVSELERHASALEFVATGADPFLILPVFPIPPDRPLQVDIELELPDPGTGPVDLYYSETAAPAFSESRKQTRIMEPNQTRLAFAFDKNTEIERLRIDPGHEPGRYVIHSIEVRAFD